MVGTSDSNDRIYICREWGDTTCYGPRGWLDYYGPGPRRSNYSPWNWADTDGIFIPAHYTLKKYTPRSDGTWYWRTMCGGWRTTGRWCKVSPPWGGATRQFILV